MPRFIARLLFAPSGYEPGVHWEGYRNPSSARMTTPMLMTGNKHVPG
jgi:hypothetical protein